MTDAPAALRDAYAAAGRPTAGGLLRAARERQGLQVAALAASVKVAPRKVEALEADRYDELPDLTFARALAQTICRVLAIDAAPVLALLPQLPNIGLGLEQVHNGLNTPLRSRSGRLPGTDANLLKRPAVWLPLLLLLAALIVWLLPQSWITRTRGVAGRVSSAPASSATSAAAPASGGAAADAPVAAAPSAEPSAAAAETPSPAASVPAPLLQLQARGDAWVEVLDARGAIVIRRLVRAGESVGLDGTPPLRVKIGNASAMALVFRGQPVVLPRSRDNIARLQLK